MIKYRLIHDRNKDTYRCDTYCPFNIISFYGNVILVGSTECGGCKNFIDYNDKERWVKCKLDDRKQKLKAIEEI